MASSIAARSVRSPDGHGDDVGAEPAHPIDVRRLARDVDFAHVYDAGQTDARARGRRRDAVLARAGFRDDALGAECLGEQGLTDRIVDLVRARMRQVFALEPDLGSPGVPERGASVSAVGRPTQLLSSQPSWPGTPGSPRCS